MMKWIAVALMTIDHLSYFFYAQLPPAAYQTGRGIGRLAFPLFAYFLVTGYRRTRSLPKYFIRLAAYALLTGLALNLTTLTLKHPELNLYRFPVDPSGNNNALYTLAIGLLVLLAYDLITKSSRDTVARLRPVPGTETAATGQPPQDFGLRINLKGISLPHRTGLLAGTALGLAALILLWLTRPDYGVYGLLTILLFHIIEERTDAYSPTLNRQLSWKKTQLHLKSFLLLNCLFLLLGYLIQLLNLSNERILFSLGLMVSPIQLCSALAPLLFPYTASAKAKKHPGPAQKHFFYLYYPLHLCLLILLRSYL